MHACMHACVKYMHGAVAAAPAEAAATEAATTEAPATEAAATEATEAAGAEARDDSGGKRAAVQNTWLKAKAGRIGQREREGGQ
ncbi:hypothetical protein ACSSS7_001380 [Eimeria intestinalis]